MRGACARLFAAAVSLLSAAAALAQQPINIYGLTIPERVGGLVPGQPVDYESKSPGLGYSVRFSGRPGWTVDVYIYDFGLATIPDDIESGIVKGQFARAKGDIAELGRRGTYANVTEQDGFTVADGGKPHFLCSAFSYLRGDRKELDVNSYLCLTSWNNKFVKIRMTAEKGLVSLNDATNFIKAWVELLRRP
jgi:hypothetical protein